MPITNCGFPPMSVIGAPPNIQITSGAQHLVFKGPTTQVEIGFDATMFQNQAGSQLLTPAQSGSGPSASPPVVVAQPKVKVVEALIDTGASESCIDEVLAQELGLPMIDQANGSGIGGTASFNVYLGHIRIVGLNAVQFGRFMGVKLTDGGQPHCALIGRSMMQNMILVYDGRTGSVSLAI